MTEPVLLRSVDDLPADFSLPALEPRPLETRVLMAEPTEFQIAYVINPHMADDAGNPKIVDRDLAQVQWEGLRDAFVAAHLEVEILEAAIGLPDLVFTANQSLSWLDRAGKLKALPSRMASAERRPEVELVTDFHRQRGAEIVDLPIPDGQSLEGAGDLLLVPGRRFCLAGVGPRSSLEVVEKLPEILDMPVALMRLSGETFYHLDTCVLPLDDRRVLVHPPALLPESFDLLGRLFELVLEPAPEEAELGLACNAVSLPGGRVIVEETCPKTAALLELQGFEVQNLPSSEYLKSGGSHFCMKLLLP